MFRKQGKKKALKNAVRLNIILFIAIMLSFNTFAWFVYSTQVSNSITTKVKAWRINFEDGENEVAEYINFEIDALKPGMPDYQNTINVVNYGETEATLNFEIVDVRVMNDFYDSATYTQTQLLDILSNNYPFTIDLTITGTVIAPNDGEVDFFIDVVWPFESGDDTLDTYWGNLSYEYQIANPGNPGISINVKLEAIQSEV